MTSSSTSGTLGLCVGCLLSEGMKEGSRAGQILGDYEILDEVARGGMGVVYRARQRRLNRDVALKLILIGPKTAPEMIEKFFWEAESVAGLDHPNIVPIYEVGSDCDEHFFSMKLIETGSLADWLAQEKLEDLGSNERRRKAAQVVMRLARAVSYAHRQGIIHRDLKPGNVLMGSDGEPYLTDFGLASLMASTDETMGEGKVVGTLPYLSPEQVTGSHSAATTAADIYSLGAILFEVLNGHPPFVAETKEKLLKKIENATPDFFEKSTDANLRAVCAKCLSKEPMDRYLTADDLADDLSSWLDGKPVSARPLTRPQRLACWGARNPILAGLAVALSIAVLAVAVTSSRLAWQAAKVREQELAAAEKNRLRLIDVNIASAKADLAKGDYLAALPRLAEALRLEDQDPIGELRHRRRISGILRHCPRLRHLWKHEQLVTRAIFSPSGNLIASGSYDGTVQIRDAQSGLEVCPCLQHQEVESDSRMIHYLEFSRDGKRLLTVCGETARVWEIPSGRLISSGMSHEENNAIWKASFDRRSELVFTAGLDGVVQVWNADTGERALAPLKHPDRVYWLDLHHNDQFLATACGDGVARVFDWKKGGNPVAEFQVAGKRVEFLTFSPDGSLLLVNDEAGHSYLWDWSGQNGGVQSLNHESRVGWGSFSPDGKKLFTVTDRGRVRLWNSETGKASAPLMQHEKRAVYGEFSPDGRRLITCSDDGTAMIWDTATGQLSAPPLRHAQLVSHVDFSPDGLSVITSTGHGICRLWDLPKELKNWERPVGLEGSSHGFSPAIDPGLKIAAIPTSDHSFRLYDLRSRRWMKQEFATSHPMIQFPDATTLATSFVPSICFSQDGERLLHFDQGNSYGVYSVQSGERLLQGKAGFFEGARAWFLGDAISPKALVIQSEVTLNQLKGDGEMQRSFETDSYINRVAISPSEDSILLGGQDGRALLYSTVEHDRDPLVFHHETWISAVAIDSAGEQMATGCHNGMIRVWHPKSRGMEAVEIEHRDRISVLSFSKNGRLLGVALEGGEAQIYSTETGEPLTAPLPHSSNLIGASFDENDEVFLVLDDQLSLSMWETDTGHLVKQFGIYPRWKSEEIEPQSTSDLLDHLHILAVSRVDPRGNLVAVPKAELIRLWNANGGR